jgi:hypothetical protein
LFRTVRWLVLVTIAWLAARSLPGFARYLRMRSM